MNWKSLFDAEMYRVLAVTGLGGLSGRLAAITLGDVAAFLGCVYVIIRIIKQIRDWKKPDSE